MLRFTKTSSALTLIVLVCCSKQEPDRLAQTKADYRQVALEFTKSLAAREYARAYAMAAEE